MIPVTQDLIHSIASERQIPLRVIPQIYELKSVPASLLPVKSPEENFIAVFTRERKTFLELPWLHDFREVNGQYIMIYPFSFPNYQRLARELPILKPSAAGLQASLGTGDRLGLVSGAHLSAMKGYDIFPVIAQQSPRELVKTGRSFPDVLLGAAFGMLESGFSRPFGADADHIKDETYLNQGIESGFSFYTLDASEVMNRQAFFLSEVELGQAYQRLTPDQLQTYKRYIDRTIRLNDDFQIGFLENRLLPILLAYDPVLHFVEKMNSILDERCPVYDLEISMDEGDALTSPEAHFFVTEELHRRGIDFQSVAPKFPGSFEKGIDYVGDTKEFTRSLRKHAMIQRMVGGYRLSLHSGSDKFSIYSVFNQETEGLFHLKTSGTSWLKALETVARHDPELFRKIYDLSRVELPENRKAYVISVREQDIQLDLESIPDKKLPDLFQNDKVRQLLHISYGSILRDFQSSLYQILFWEEDDHYHLVKEHIGKHLELLLGKKKR